MKAKHGRVGREVVERAALAACEELEGRVLLSKARIVDAGDFYWNADTKVELLRATDRVIVGFEPASAARVRRLTNGLTGKGGALEGYSPSAALKQGTQLFVRTARGISPSFEDLESKVQETPAVKYLAPTFFKKQGGRSRFGVTDQFDVDLRNDVNAASFFGSDNVQYAPAGYGTNVFAVTLDVGGGLDALAKAAQLHGNAQVDNVTELPDYANGAALALPPGLVDAGDQRWLYDPYNRPEELVRTTDWVLVGFVPSSAARVRRLSAALTSSTGALAGYEVLETYRDTQVLFRRIEPGLPPTLDTLQQKIGGFPAIKHLSPTFFARPDWGRLVIFDSLYVNLANSVDPATVLTEGFSSYQIASVPFNAWDATLESGGAIEALRVADSLRQQAYVDSVDVNFAAQVILLQTTAQEELDNPQWNLRRINATHENDEDAWDFTTGSSDVVIAILDNGVQTNHPELGDRMNGATLEPGNIFVNDAEVSGTGGVDDDGNGYVDDVNGWDFYSNDRDASPADLPEHYVLDASGNKIAVWERGREGRESFFDT